MPALKAIFTADTSDFKRGIIEMQRMSEAAAKRMQSGNDWSGKGPEGLNAIARENARQIALNRNKIQNLLNQEREAATAATAIEREKSRIADVEAAKRSNLARRLVRERAQRRADDAANAKAEAHEEAVQARLKRMQVGGRLRQSAADAKAEAHEEAVQARLKRMQVGGMLRQSAADAKAEAHEEAVQARLKRMQVGGRLRQSAADAKAEAHEAAVQARLRNKQIEHRKHLRALEAAEEAKRNSFGARAGRFFGSVSGSFIGVGAAVGGIYKVIEFFKDSVQVNIQLQQMFSTLRQVSGSSIQAASDMKFLYEESKRVGFSFLESGRAFARFNAAAKAANLTTQETRRIFISVQEGALVMGMSTDQMASSMLALEQMLSKGTVMSQELRLQLGNAMPGAMNIFADAMGLSMQALYKLVEEGLVPAKEAVKLFGMEMEKRFKLSDEALKTVRELNRMKTAMDALKGSAGEIFAPTVESVAKAAASVSEFFGQKPDKMGQPGRPTIAAAILSAVTTLDFHTLARILADRLKPPGEIGPTRADFERVEGIEAEQEIERAKLRAKGREDLIASQAEATANLEREAAQKRKDREFKKLSREDRIARLQEEIANRQASHEAARNWMTPKELAQDQLELERLRDDLQGELAPSIKGRSGVPGVLTDQERRGASMGAGVTLLDTTKSIHKELVGIHRYLVTRGSGGSAQSAVHFGGL